MLDDALGGEQSESESSLSDNLSYAEFLVSHHKKFMDHLQKAFAVSAGNAAAAAATATGASPGVLVNREDLIDVALAETALDDFNERNNYTASVIFTELADDITKSSGFFHAGNMTNEEYEQFLADLWVGIVLTLMVLSCVCCMCSCLLYHKFQQWKRSVLENRTNSNPEAGDNESLPSYTIASGLPSYEEALEQLKTIKTNSLICSALSNHITPNSKSQESTGAIAPVHHHSPPPQSINNDTPISPTQQTSPVAQSTQPGYATSASMARLSVIDLFQIYKNNNSTTDSLSKT